MKKDQSPIIVEDNVTNSAIMRTIKDEIYLIKDGKKMRLNAFIIKQSRERN